MTELIDHHLNELQPNLYRNFFEFLNEPAFLIRMNPDGSPGRFLEANEMASNTLGYSHEEFLKLTPKDINTAESYANFLATALVQLKAHGHAQFEATHLHKSGKPVPVEIMVRIVRSVSEKYLVVIVKNLSSIKKAEETLREAGARLTLALDVGSIGTWEWNLESNEVLLDERFNTLLGYNCGELPNNLQDWLPYHHPDDMVIWKSKAEAYLRGETPIYESEHRVRHKDGSWNWVFTRGKLINHSTTGAIKKFIGIAMNVTAQKKSEEMLKQMVNRLNLAQFAAGAGLWDWDIVTDKITWTDQMFALFGLDPRESTASLATWLQVIHPEDIENANSKLEQSMKEKKDLHSDYRVIHPNGQIRWINSVGRTEYNESGQPIRMMGICIDITLRKKNEEEKQDLEKRLQRAEKMEALGLLAGGVAHDLNNVLGIVVGYTELILHGMQGTDALKIPLEKIMHGADRATSIVQDLLTLARRGITDKKVINLNDVIKEQQTLEIIKFSTDYPSVQINFDLDAELMNISGSCVHIGKTIFNLILNAGEAMPHGGSISLKTFNQYLDRPVHGYDEIHEGDYVVLTVSDSGIGIAENDLKHIFEPFYTKKIMGSRGTGLGLAVVWGTVKDHNGYIDVQSKIGKGSIFTLYFPVTRTKPSSENTHVPLSEYMGKGETILVVDDMDGQRELATEMLQTLNYKVSSVCSGKEAIAFIADNRVDLMVIDMIMDPGIDGLDTYEKILEISPLQKAILVSGFSETDRVNKALRLGAGAYVKKPYLREKLGLAVRKELDRN